ncbi:hypothetical protein O181_029527 [Austropuccinia psidii MF-1]|uniref:Uncharacterized protein n=1 Tax=Austropuccinia psidii MF-1 TaxID=1389203 RepID=A0A9Q3CWS2_9BASI|nr:hypothetical protein [Austropuccinia psidii MF-1]
MTSPPKLKKSTTTNTALNKRYGSCFLAEEGPNHAYLAYNFTNDKLTSDINHLRRQNQSLTTDISKIRHPALERGLKPRGHPQGLYTLIPYGLPPNNPRQTQNQKSHLTQQKFSRESWYTQQTYQNG